MSSNPAIELGSALQSASIQRHPSPTHDLNPSTSASTKIPVTLADPSPDDLDGDSALVDDEIPVNVLRPLPRRQTMPPLPDMRFEQSYLRSLDGASGWKGVGWITVRDQVMLPLIQGFAWSLIVFGWRHWNQASSLSGASLGAKVRRWWWGVNNWKIPASATRSGSLADRKFAGEVREFYEFEFGNAGAD